MAELDPYVLDVSEEKERTERNRGNRLGRTSSAQNGVADSITRHHVHVIKFTRADLGDAGPITGMIKSSPACERRQR